MTPEQINKLKKLWEKMTKTQKESSDYFSQFLHETEAINGTVVRDKPPTKWLNPKEQEVLEELWEKRDRAQKALADYEKQIAKN